MPTAEKVRRQLENLGDPTIAAHSQRFFKTGPGEYGEGDRFRGIRVPVLRRVVREHRTLPHRSVVSLLRSAFHEDRLTALLILVAQYEAGDERSRGRVYDTYLDSTEFINNWDLVDSSAHKIVGAHLIARSRQPLYEFAGSKSLWERRIAIIATLRFIQQHDFDDTLRLAELLLEDPEDLIHKAVGWMLREVGNRDRQREETFLASRYPVMPRTMLRYAIEKFPERLRRRYLAGTIQTP